MAETYQSYKRDPGDPNLGGPADVVGGFAPGYDTAKDYGADAALIVRGRTTGQDSAQTTPAPVAAFRATGAAGTQGWNDRRKRASQEAALAPPGALR